MATDQLSLYNGALRVIGERRLANLAENVESRHELDDLWDDDVVGDCLEKGAWNFATRTQQLDASPSVEPSFGYRYAFEKPEDWVRTVAISADPYFNTPLTQVVDEDGFWFSNYQTIYVRFVSDDEAYGRDLSKWPRSFTKFVQAHMGASVALRLSKGETILDRATKEAEKRLSDALMRDAVNTPTAFPPPGSWVQARMGGSTWGRRGR